jgi:FtsP/CotA-like multicopper oxidase with cupredoxin domain
MRNTQFVSKILRASLCAAVAGCAVSGAVNPVDVPAPLNAPDSQILTRQLHATGVQIYRCQPAKGDPAQFEWSFKEPEATLFGKAGRTIGKHYAGPTWEANDGSKVTGEVIARANSPAPDAIPWLLLSAKTTSGTGIFSAVRSIQRLHTVGGAAPAGGCNQAQAGEELRVSYSADYLFYTARP